MNKIGKTKLPPVEDPQQAKAVFVMEEALKSVLNAVGFRSGVLPARWERFELKLDIPNTVKLELVLQGSHRHGDGNDIDAAFVGDHAAMSMLTTTNVDDLDLAPHAKAGAQSLVKDFGASIVFTSGRRSVPDQCRAMAQNIVNTGDRKWIEKTYANSGARKKLQDWVDANPAAKTVAQLKAGLEGVMNGFSNAELYAISYHLNGAAFDLGPVGGADGDKIKQAINALPHKRKFIDGESGVNVWHVDFNE